MVILMNNILIKKIKTKLDQSITLVGLMGSGKSSVGRLLANELDWPFIDSDAEIVTQAGLSIPEIFESKGEAYFRELERDILKNLTAQDDLRVIGTGGGAFMNDKTRDYIKDKTISVFLQAELDTLIKRVGSGAGRPLFKDQSPTVVLAELIDLRYPRYKEARILVDTKDETPQETLNRVLQALYNDLPSV